MKSIGNIANYTLLALWLISVGILITFGIKQATEVAYSGKEVQKEILAFNSIDTLQIQFKFNNYYDKEFRYNNFEVTQDENGKEILYSNDVSIELMYTDEASPYLQIERKAEGNSMLDAKKRASKINYNFKFEGNKLILDNYLITDLKSKYRSQEVELYLYLPKGTLFKVDSNVQEYDESNNGFFNLHFSSDAFIYKVEPQKVYCLNCPTDENEYNDIANDTILNSSTSITIDQNGIQIKEENKPVENKEFKGLKIDKNGIIIKTN
jgi:hypothetical protein